MNLPPRPRPPQGLLAFDHGPNAFLPAPEVLDWVATHVLAEDGALYNPDHAHLLPEKMGVLWALPGARSGGRSVVGMAELFQPRGKHWIKARQQFQMEQWFDGHAPEVVITLSAEYSAEVDDATWCSLVEHELYHVAHDVDQYGAPRFHRDGSPMYRIQAHDAEEFVGVVARYGDGAAAGDTAALVAAANRKPSVAAAAIAGACGTCRMAA